MLRHLRVENFALLSTVSIDFAAGMNVLTGETGAGKSLVVEAVNLLRGGRASADIPRKGADQAVVEAVFEVPDDLAARASGVLAAAGLPDDAQGSEVLVRRVIHRGGRSRTYINGALTTATRLAELGRMLVDLSGQHQHQDLSDASRHRAILDEFGEHQGVAGAVAEAVAEWTSVKDQLAALAGAEATRAQRADYIRFQLDELTRADLCADEDAGLDTERTRLKNTDTLSRATSSAESLLYSGEGSALDRIDSALRELSTALERDPSLASAVRPLEDAREHVEACTQELRHYAAAIEGDPARLEEVEERLALIRRLERKHGCDLATLIEKREALSGEFALLDDADGQLAHLEAQAVALEERARKAAAALSKARKKTARRLDKEVNAVLAELGMGAAKLTAHVSNKALSADGADHVEFLLTSNRGEDQKALSRIASGGELSRIMLALKLVLRTADGVATYVLDEVDAGIGGATAGVVGEQIRKLACSRQVLCVTHLAQIAAHADAHLRVEKSEQDGRTETSVSRLTGAKRKGEIARMLGGKENSRQARAHASELLSQAQRAS